MIVLLRERMNVSMDEQNHVSFSVHNYTVSLGMNKLFYIPFHLVIKPKPNHPELVPVRVVWAPSSAYIQGNHQKATDRHPVRSKVNKHGA